MNLEDTIAVVTGASRGLGLAFSDRLVSAGATVYGLARSEDDLQKHQERWKEHFHPIRCDVTSLDDVEASFARIEQEAGRLDVLINNAGLGRFGETSELPLEDWHTMVDTNLTGLFYCTRVALPLLKWRKDEDGIAGHIVNVASIAGLIGNPELGGYNATKFGVRGFSEALMKEQRPDGVKVTTLYPGSVNTYFFEVAEAEMSPNAMSAGSVADTMLHVLEASAGTLVSEVVLRPMLLKAS